MLDATTHHQWVMHHTSGVEGWINLPFQCLGLVEATAQQPAQRMYE